MKQLTSVRHFAKQNRSSSREGKHGTSKKMGIKNLSKFIRTHYKSSAAKLDLKSLRFKKIAIDTSIFMCKFKATAGDDWLVSFVSMICSFRKLDIHPIFVFDNALLPKKASNDGKEMMPNGNSANESKSLNKQLKSTTILTIPAIFYRRNTTQK